MFLLRDRKHRDYRHLHEERTAKKCWTGTVSTQEEENMPHTTLGAISSIGVDMTAPPNASLIATTTVAAPTTDMVPTDMEDSKLAAKPSVCGVKTAFVCGGKTVHVHFPTSSFQGWGSKESLLWLLLRLILNPLLIL